MRELNVFPQGGRAVRVTVPTREDDETHMRLLRHAKACNIVFDMPELFIHVSLQQQEKVQYRYAMLADGTVVRRFQNIPLKEKSLFIATDYGHAFEERTQPSPLPTSPPLLPKATSSVD